MFIGLLTIVGNRYNHTKHVFLSNQKCTIQPTLINLYPNEYTQGLRYYPFALNFDRCVKSCNTINDLIEFVFETEKKI